MSNEVIGSEIQFKIDKALAALKEIGDAGSAAGKDVARELSRGLKAAEKAAKDAAKATRTAADATKDFGDRAGRTGQNASKMAGALSLISPQAAEAARTLADMADVGEVGAASSEALGVSLAATGAAVVALSAAAVIGYGVWNYYAVASDHAAAKQERLNAVMEAGASASSRLAALGLDLAVATGSMTSEEASYQRSVVSAKAALDAKADSVAKETGLTEAQMQAAMAAAAHSEEASASQSEAQKKAVGLMAVANAEYGGTVILLGKVRDATLSAKAADEAKVAATNRRKTADDSLTVSTKAQSAAMAESIALMEEDSRLTAQVTAGIAGMRDTADGAALARLDGEAKVTAALDRRLEQLEAEYQATIRLASSDAERLDALAARNDATVQLERTAQSEIDKIREDAAQKDRDRLDELHAQQLGHVNEVGGYVTQSLGMMSSSLDESYQMSADMATRLEAQLVDSEAFLTDSQNAALEERTEQAKEAARKQFNAAKAAKVAEAIASTALAAINAIAQSPPPSPFGLIGAGIATAAGIAATASISSTQPAFHKGGPLDLAPDEMSITARRGEYVLNPTGRQAIGDDNLRAANAGKGGGGGGSSVVAVSVYKHTRQVDTWKKDGLLAGDPIAKAIDSGKLVGHRSR